jgi:hypothetical protein
MHTAMRAQDPFHIDFFDRLDVMIDLRGGSYDRANRSSRMFAGLWLDGLHRTGWRPNLLERCADCNGGSRARC